MPTKKNEKSTDLEQVKGGELTELEAAELALSDAALDDIGLDDLVIPMLKLTQPLTDEVTDGAASPGEFINSITGESYGQSIGFIVAAFQKGRFQAAQDGTIIEASPDSSGLSSKGVPYHEDPDAEEQYKAAVNRKEKEWGSGPPISTTYNFIGFVVVDGEVIEFPVRLSLQRTSAPAAKKWLTALKFAKPMWGTVFNLGVKQEKGAKGTYYLPTVRAGGPATTEARQAAVSLAQSINAGEAKLVDDTPPEEDLNKVPAAPASEPGLDI